MVSTPDSESGNPSSNLGGTFLCLNLTYMTYEVRKTICAIDGRVRYVKVCRKTKKTARFHDFAI